MVKVSEVAEVVARLKAVVAPMAWAKKPNRNVEGWREYSSALEYVDDRTQTPELLLIRCTWRQQLGVMPESWTFALWHQGERVLATDFQPIARHKNNAGNGRPLYGQYIAGMHVHTWSDDGYGYAEPLPFLRVPPSNEAWGFFCEKAGILNPGFVHPDRDVNAGQQLFNFEQ